MHIQATEYGQKGTMRGGEELDKFSGVGVRYIDRGEEVVSAARCPLLVDQRAIDQGLWVVVVVVDDGIDQLCWKDSPRCWVGMIHCAGSLDPDIRNLSNIYRPLNGETSVSLSSLQGSTQSLGFVFSM